MRKLVAVICLLFVVFFLPAIKVNGVSLSPSGCSSNPSGCSPPSRIILPTAPTTLTNTKPTSNFQTLTHLDVWLTTTNDPHATPVVSVKAGSVDRLYIWAQDTTGQEGDFDLWGVLQDGTRSKLSSFHNYPGYSVNCGDWEGQFLTSKGTVKLEAYSVGKLVKTVTFTIYLSTSTSSMLIQTSTSSIITNSTTSSNTLTTQTSTLHTETTATATFTIPTTQQTTPSLTQVNIWFTTTNNSTAMTVNAFAPDSVNMLYIWAQGGEGQTGDFTLTGILQNGNQTQLGSTFHATPGKVISCGTWNGGFLNTLGNVTVNSISGGTVVGSATFTITNNPITVTNTTTITSTTTSATPQLSLSTPVISGLKVTINGVANPAASNLSITKIGWDWGDGTTDEQWFSATHTYATAGQYTVKATAYQSNGLTTTKSVNVTVQP